MLSRLVPLSSWSSVSGRKSILVLGVPVLSAWASPYFSDGRPRIFLYNVEAWSCPIDGVGRLPYCMDWRPIHSVNELLPWARVVCEKG